jgi:hypothetical protein
MARIEGRDVTALVLALTVAGVLVALCGIPGAPFDALDPDLAKRAIQPPRSDGYRPTRGLGTVTPPGPSPVPQFIVSGELTDSLSVSPGSRADGGGRWRG